MYLKKLSNLDYLAQLDDTGLIKQDIGVIQKKIEELRVKKENTKESQEK